MQASISKNRSSRLLRLGAIVAVLLLHGLSRTALADNATCVGFERQHRFENTVVTSSTMHASSPRAPAFCEVIATISPVDGSDIGVVLRLPDDWNGKLLGLGGGGYAGNISLNSAIAGLARGYVTMQTDTGHPVAAPFDTRWAFDDGGQVDWVAIEDFGFRAVHEMTVLGKAIAAAYYGRSHERAYWQGCSTGGRQGFMEVQRYPHDYDGVIAGAPVYDFLTTTGALLRFLNFSAPERRLEPAHLDLINRSVLAACDANDGVIDGIVADPRACDWDPGALQCEAGAESSTCLTLPQIDAVRTAYTGVRTSDGRYAAYPLSRGSETGWQRFYAANDGPPDDMASVGLSGLRAVLLGDADFDLRRFDAERDVQAIRTSRMAATYEAPDATIDDFVVAGGKLIIWHGFYDPGPSALATVDYYERVEAQNAGETRDSVRLFLVPGVAHCGGGPGPDQFDLLSALEAWVETGDAPDQVVATTRDLSLTMPVCAYPALPKGLPNSDGYSCE